MYTSRESEPGLRKALGWTVIYPTCGRIFFVNTGLKSSMNHLVWRCFESFAWKAGCSK